MPKGKTESEEGLEEGGVEYEMFLKIDFGEMLSGTGF